MPERPTVDVGYHGQTAVDAKHKLLVEQHVTKAVTDVAQLSALAMAAQETRGVAHLKLVAAMGYEHGEAINAGEAAGLEPYLLKPLTSANRQLRLDGQEQFTYDPAHDCYQCPARQHLPFRVATVKPGRPLRDYATTAGRPCAMNTPCTRTKAGRRIPRLVPEPLCERRHTRAEAHPGVMTPRQQIIDHPLGTSKSWNAHASFLMRGMANVRAEMSRSALVDHRKWLRPLLGRPTLTAAVTCAGRRL